MMQDRGQEGALGHGTEAGAGEQVLDVPPRADGQALDASPRAGGLSLDVSLRAGEQVPDVPLTAGDRALDVSLRTGGLCVPDGCSVRILDIRSLSERDSEQVARVLPGRYARAGEFRFPEDRLRCIGAGKLLIDEVGVTRESQIALGAQGKPTAKGLSPFNLSHSGNYVLCATAPFPVGVDIELMDERHLSVAKRVFTLAELAWMEGEPLERFHVLWTQKEAVMKLDGGGFAIDPASFEMDPLGLSGATVLRGRNVLVSSFRHDDCIASVATYA